VRTQRIVIVVTSCFIAVVRSLSATERKQRPSMRMLIRTEPPPACKGIRGRGSGSSCSNIGTAKGTFSHPYLEVDIREQPISIHKSTSIGSENWAFRWLNPKESCEQALSGSVVFDHFEDPSGKGIQTDGYYELRFSSGRTESGLFKVDCIAPCG